ncbi:hypothetical protein PCK2_000986 [Pneumocystis canis]|nr:hypothetical protein PCK2_000986 [Pneumocystis canis]
MSIKHNNMLPNQHFRKDWQRRVRTWFDQEGHKLRRRKKRLQKATALAPRPVELLRPTVYAPTIKYNRKMRLGRGFTLEELKAAGISRRYALTIGISVDHRRCNRSVESLERNVKRLQLYKKHLIVFPRKTRKAEKSDSDDMFNKKYVQVSVDEIVPPPVTVIPTQSREITQEEKEISVYATLRTARKNAKLANKKKAEKDEVKE